MPGTLRRAKNFAAALLRDAAAGQPRRTPELVARIYDRYCAMCPRNVAGNCAHPDCGCPIAREPIAGRRNKLEWGAEKCPDGKWPIQKTNLIFYILPLKNTANVWQWHVSQLRKYANLFNGRRIVTIATAGPTERLALDSPAEVRRAFGADADGIEFLERPNDPNYWETPAFRDMLAMIESRDPAEATFYFHAKGVRRANQTAIRPWCKAIYEHNLDRFDEVREILSAYPVCGIAKIPQNPNAFPGGGNWHFAGTGFWFNHAALFSRTHWHSIHDHSHAVEGYLSTQFDSDDAYCLAYAGIANVYSASTWIDPPQNPEPRTPASQGHGPEPSVSVIVTARNYGHYLRDCLSSCLSQSRPALEVIYCDDASTDDSAAIAAEFPAVRVIRRETSNGVEDARNHAAAGAKGRCLLFVDGDNLLPTNYLATMASKLTNDTPFVYPDLRRFGDSTEFTPMPEWGKQDLRRQNFCDTCSLIWTEAFWKVGAWQPGYAHLADWNLFLRLARLGAPARAGVALHYREHGGSMSAATKGRLSPAELADLERRVVADAGPGER